METVHSLFIIPSKINLSFEMRISKTLYIFMICAIYEQNVYEMLKIEHAKRLLYC